MEPGHSGRNCIKRPTRVDGPAMTVRFSARMAALAVLAAFPFDVEAASCGSYPKDIRVAIKKHVETLRALERETTDRLKGLDTRTFDYLAAQARAASGAIADKNALAAEEELSRCRESIPPVRRVCARRRKRW